MQNEPQDEHATAGRNSRCPLCGSLLKWKLSERGRHFVGICNEHGFMQIIRHPLLEQVERPRGIIERIGDYMMGR